jgi:hypothetical protein
MHTLSPCWSGEWGWVYVPMYTPYQAQCTTYHAKVPFELAATASDSPQEAMIGGECAVRPTLEYFVEAGAAAPAVTITITSGGSTTTVSETNIEEGYYVKHNLPPLEPGTLVSVEVVDATARLRWCESICC